MKAKYDLHHRAHLHLPCCGKFLGQSGNKLDGLRLPHAERQSDDCRIGRESLRPSIFNRVDVDASRPPANFVDAGAEMDFRSRQVGGRRGDESRVAAGHTTHGRFAIGADGGLGLTQPRGADPAGVGGVEAFDVIECRGPFDGLKIVELRGEKVGEGEIGPGELFEPLADAAP